MDLSARSFDLARLALSLRNRFQTDQSPYLVNLLKRVLAKSAHWKYSQQDITNRSRRVSINKIWRRFAISPRGARKKHTTGYSWAYYSTREMRWNTINQPHTRVHLFYYATVAPNGRNIKQFHSSVRLSVVYIILILGTWNAIMSNTFWKNRKKSKVFILQVLPIESVEFILFSHAKFLWAWF